MHHVVAAAGPPRALMVRGVQSSRSASGSAPPRASHVASRSTGTSKSGNWSTNACIWSASQASVTCSSPRRSASSSSPRSVKYTGSVGEGFGDQLTLLDLVHLGRTDGGAGRRLAADPAEDAALGQLLRQVDRHELPGAHVHRLFLYPDDVGGVRVALELLADLLGRQRVELLDPDDG